jgi:hypothetical protein
MSFRKTVACGLRTSADVAGQPRPMAPTVPPRTMLGIGPNLVTLNRCHLGTL